MRFNKCLLVRPSYGQSRHAIATIPVGLGYIAEALAREGIDYELFDMAFEDQGLKKYDVQHLKEKVKELKPDVIGFSLMTLSYKQHYALIEEIKKDFPEVIIVVGGPHVSTLREKVLDECFSIDFGFVLEADESFPALCRGEKVHDIKGILYRDGERVVYTGDREFIKDLNGLPFPRYAKFELDKYSNQTMYLSTSRGCPNECTYCPVKLAVGRRFRYVNADTLINEISYWYSKGYRQFGFWDDNFTLLKQRVFSLCDMIEQKKFQGCSFSLPNGIRADKVDRELLKRMRSVGFRQLSIGVESASDKVLKILKKGETIEQIEEAIKDSTELGFDVYLYFILGSPGETMEDVEKSFNLALKYPIVDAIFHKMTPYPGTELFEWVTKRNLFLRLPEEYLNDANYYSAEPFFVTDELPYEDRVLIFKRSLDVSKIIRIRRKKRQMVRLGLVGKILAHFSQTNLFINLYRNSIVLRNFASRIRPWIISR